jgi:peptidoglycan-associated lipoprotein
MKIFRLLALLVFAICVTGQVVAQKGIKKADDEFNNRAYTEAAKLYKLAEATTKGLDNKAAIFFKIGECYRMTAQFNQALEWYEKAITAQYYNINSEVYYSYGNTLQLLGRWDDAIAQYNKYNNKGGDKTKGNAAIEACTTASKKKNEKSKIIVENCVELNSPAMDLSLRYSSKKNDQMVFTTTRQSTMGDRVDVIHGQDFSDIFFVEVDKKGKFGVPQPVEGGVNTKHHEGASAFLKDFGTMYYTQCRDEGKAWFACDILYAEADAKGFAQADTLFILDRLENDTAVVGHPTFTPDEKFLIFASDMAGGKGGKDLWYVTFEKKSGKIGKPVNLGGLNTAGDEMFPWVSADGVLYYSSDGRGGLGGLDIFKADKTGDLNYGNPVALDYPINSTSHDYAFILDERGDKDRIYAGYFTSDRPGGKGSDDIYHFTEPPLEFTLVGTAYDKDTGTPLAGANVTVTGSDGSSIKLTADGNGGFNMDKSQLKANTSYVVDIQKDKYIGTGDKFSTVGLKSSTNFAREYFLIPIPEIGVEISMPLVQYPYNETVLLINDEVNSADSLNFLLEILRNNPKFKIQLEAHTDFRGKDDYNLKLSEGRAKTCVDYLISKGIAADRMVPVGMGEKQPRTLTTDNSGFKAGTVLTEKYITALPKEQQEAAHTLNRRTIFKIIDTNYVSSSSK